MATYLSVVWLETADRVANTPCGVGIVALGVRRFRQR